MCTGDRDMARQFVGCPAVQAENAPDGGDGRWPYQSEGAFGTRCARQKKAKKGKGINDFAGRAVCRPGCWHGCKRRTAACTLTRCMYLVQFIL